ncbi:MAG: YrhA family protein [Rikenellaceae bacterium]
MEKIRDIISRLNRDHALLCPPASDSDIESVNSGLQSAGIGQLPTDLVNFFKICGGVEYNGMVIYGTHNNQIVTHNEDRHDYHQGYPHLLFFGSIDDDIYTYNTSTHRYESRDINGMECWEEYDSFVEFFYGEMTQWLC